ncbi:MAG: GAF domain-containing protein [Sulfurisoma sp.]|nr:GAF domain-containing protein [Sulfurisoma sp.]
MDISYDTIRDIFQHRLKQSDIDRLLSGLSEARKTELFNKIGDLLRRTSALIEIANNVSGSLSLDLLFVKLIETISETLNAERSSLFLHDAETGELFSRVLQGDGIDEIRFRPDRGIAGDVFSSGQAALIPDAYADPRFNPDFDRRTGFRTRDVLCVPLRNKADAVVGVTMVLNKREGAFDVEDQRLLGSLGVHIAAALENARLFEKVEQAQREEALLLEVTNALVSELDLGRLLDKIVNTACTLLDADRGTLFLHDADREELYSRVARGGDVEEIRFPARAGLAGECFSANDVINIADAYADPRFNPAVDRNTLYRTRCILCVPVVNKWGARIGVLEVLNKRGGSFQAQDERRLGAFAAQAAICLENARLFEEISNARGYSEAILKSLSAGVITLDAERRIKKLNTAALRILRLHEPPAAGDTIDQLCGSSNSWLGESVSRVAQSGRTDIQVDTDLQLPDGTAASINLTTVPLVSMQDKRLGTLLVIEDISREKRLKNTMSRYMSKAVMERLLESGDAVLGGTGQDVSVLFSDIRGFTAMSAKLGPRETVAMLNEYFTEMVDVVFAHDGILDKYIGDAVMAVFGSPFKTDHDADNAVAVANRMMIKLGELNLRRTSRGAEPIRIGVGISSGEVVAGNIGSPKRMEYTVIGDRVNLAPRLESANKYYGTSILLSEFTVAELKRPATLRRIDSLRVRGRQEPVTIYEALDFHTAETFPRITEVLEAFAAGMADYQARRWDAAVMAFRAALAAHPEDRPTAIYLERCEHYRRLPPPPAWDGTWEVAAS